MTPVRNWLTLTLFSGAGLDAGSALGLPAIWAGKSQYLQMLRKGLQVAVGFGAQAALRLVIRWVLFKNPQSFQLIMGVN